jgi:anti-anti-sigma regulatory factor
MAEREITTKTAPEYEEQIAALSTQLAESQQIANLLRAIADNSPAMLYQWVLFPNGEARFTFVSEACRDIYEISPSELLADMRYSMRVIHPDDVPIFSGLVEESARTMEPFQWEGRIVLFKPQRMKWIRAISKPHRMPDGVTAWDGAVFDVTKEREAAARLLASEQERSGLIEQLREQNEKLSLQAAELQVLSTPIIPLADDVLALPIVGEINPERAQRILESVLTSVTAKSAQFVILDITGVHTVDAYAAEALVRTASALKLLGATAILTGVQPNTARVLIELGADLSTLITRSTFQDGIAYTRTRVRRRA